MLNFFAINKEESSVSIEQLGKIAKSITQASNNSLIVNVDRFSIEDALAKRANLLTMENDDIHLKNRDSLVISMIDVVNNDMPKFVSDLCKNNCKL